LAHTRNDWFRFHHDRELISFSLRMLNHVQVVELGYGVFLGPQGLLVHD
jgi:hypothetical protein